jgi:hypothetical protein
MEMQNDRPNDCILCGNVLLGVRNFGEDAMTDDLVKRLRDLVNDDDTEMLAWEAADRIEQLEEIMIWVRGTIGADHPAKKVIRVALGEKKDA